MERYREFPNGAFPSRDASPMPFAIARWEGEGSCNGRCVFASEGGTRVYPPVHPATRGLFWPRSDAIPLEFEHCHVLTRRGLRVCDSACPTLVKQAL
jgi:hypothetical protein